MPGRQEHGTPLKSELNPSSTRAVQVPGGSMAIGWAGLCGRVLKGSERGWLSASTGSVIA